MRDKLIEKIKEKLENYSTEELVETFNIDIPELIWEECMKELDKKEIDDLLEFALEL